MNENKFIIKNGVVVESTSPETAVFEIEGSNGLLVSINDTITGDTFTISNVTGGTAFSLNSDGNISVERKITAFQFTKSGGTSSQFLKADGSTDSNSYSQVGHTHPYLSENGGTVSGNLYVAGDLVVTGSTYQTHVNEIFTKNDYITLREGAVSGLANGAYTGIEAIKYDGTNNGRLVFDNQGWAKVGDSGNEQVIATRISSPGDGQVAIWDANNYRLNFIPQTTFAPASGSPNYIQLSPANAQSGNIKITGTMNWGTGAGSSVDASGLWIEQVGTNTSNENIRLQTSKSGDLTNYISFVIDPTSGFQFNTTGSGNGVATFSSTITSTGFIKSGSTDSYVLLGAGGHKAVSDFVVSSVLGNYSLTGHTHDDRYYTETESNARYLGISSKAVDSDKLDGNDSTYFAAASSLSNYSLTSHNHSGVYEPTFTKNTAFNKNFGTSAGTVAEGNDSRIVNGQTAFGWGNHASAGYALASHNHDTVYHPLMSTIFSLEGSYVAVRTANRTASQYYEFWDSGAGWAKIYSGGFVNANSSDSYILLGGGGTKAISDFALASTLTSHTGNTSNPHSVTAAQVGAVALSGTPLTSGQDLNALTNVGTWYTTSTAIDYSLVNRPPASSGECYIVNRGIAGYLEQEFLEVNGCSRWFREYRGGTWGIWRQNFNSSNLLNIGTTASTARTALGLGSMATETASNYLSVAANQTVVGQKTFNTGGYAPVIIDRTGAYTNTNILFRQNGTSDRYLGYDNNFDLRWGDNPDSSINYKIYHSGNLLNIGTTAFSARTALGLGSMALETASNYSLTSHTHSYITSTRYDSGDPKPNQLTVGLSFQFSYPDGGWYNAINMRSYADPNYLATQIVSSANNPGTDTGYSYSLKYREGRNATWLDWKTILDSSNFSSYALPLSGGTLSGDLTTKSFWSGQDGTGIYFEAIGTYAVNGLRLQHPKTGGGYNQLLINGTNNQLLYNGSQLLSTANYSSYALPLSGGTLNGADAILNINSSTTHAWMYFKTSNINKASIGYFNGLAFIANDASTARIGVNDAGTPQYWTNSSSSTAQNLIHAGNIGYQSVNYATSANSANNASFLYSNGGGAVSSLQYWQSLNNPLNPDSSWWYALRMGHGDADTYYSATLAISFFADVIKFRRKAGGGDNPWQTLWHTGNSNSSSVAWAASTFTEGGTLLSNKYTRTNGVANVLYTPAYLTVNLNTVDGLAGIVYTEGQSCTNAPTSYGSFLQFADEGGNDVRTQFWNSHNGAEVYTRIMWGNADWKPWRKLWHDGNLTNTLSNGYLPYWNGSSVRLESSAIFQKTDGSSNVGVSNSNPQRRLHINSYSSPALRLENIGSNQGIEMLTDTSKHSWLLGAQYNIDGGFEITPSTEVGGTTFSTPVAVFKANGNVGIGTTNPDSKFSVLSNNSVSVFGYAAKFLDERSSGYYAPFSFEVKNGDHSWGVVARFHTFANTGTDRPSIAFSSGYSNTRWNIGYCYVDDNFRIVQDMGIRPDYSGVSDSWGITRFKIFTNGNVTIGHDTDLGYKLAVAGNIGAKGDTFSFYNTDTTGYYDTRIVLESSMDYRGRGIHLRYTGGSESWWAGIPYTGGGYSIGYGTDPYTWSNYKMKIGTDGIVTFPFKVMLGAAESINLYGIRGRFANEHIHLYNKVNIGDPSGWGNNEAITPTYGLSTYGGAVLAYTTGSVSIGYNSIQTDYKFKVNGTSYFNGSIEINSWSGIFLKVPNYGYWNIAPTYNYTNPDLIFAANGSEKARFNADGNFGIGYGNKVAYKLAVNGDAYFNAGITAAADSTIGKNEAVSHKLQILTGAANSAYIHFYPYSMYGFVLGNFNVGGNNQFQLRNNADEVVVWFGNNNDKNGYFSGGVTATAFYHSSDMTLKNVISPLESSLDKLRNMSTFYYTLKDDSSQRIQLGMSAQEFDTYFPTLVGRDSNDKLQLEYPRISVLAVKAIQELDAIQKEQQKKISNLEDEIKQLKQIIYGTSNN